MIYAFKDAADGYYQTDVPEGDQMPAWTNGMTPCSVQTTATMIAPMTATPYQFKAALVQQGLYAQALAAVNAGDVLTQLAWAEAQTFVENDSHIVAIATALGKTISDIHGLFQLAGTLAP